LELNPLAGLHPVRSDLVILARLAGIDHRTLIDRIVDSFLVRHPMLAAAARPPVPA
jgi:D-alanine-D-alanine ligase